MLLTASFQYLPSTTLSCAASSSPVCAIPLLVGFLQSSPSLLSNPTGSFVEHNPIVCTMVSNPPRGCSTAPVTPASPTTNSTLPLNLCAGIFLPSSSKNFFFAASIITPALSLNVRLVTLPSWYSFSPALPHKCRS